MKILASIRKEKEGNDCWITDSVAIMESYPSIIIIHHKHVSGWCESNEAHTKVVDSVSDAKEELEYFDFSDDNLKDELIEQLKENL